MPMNLAFSELLRTVLWHRFMLLFCNRISVWCGKKDSVTLKSKRLLIPLQVLPDSSSLSSLDIILRWFLLHTKHCDFTESGMHSETSQVLLRGGEHNSFSRTAFTTPTDIQINKTKAGKTSLVYLNWALWTDLAFLSTLICFDSLS